MAPKRPDHRSRQASAPTRPQLRLWRSSFDVTRTGCPLLLTRCILNDTALGATTTRIALPDQVELKRMQAVSTRYLTRSAWFLLSCEVGSKSCPE